DAVAVRGLQGDHALPAAAVRREFLQRRALAVARGGGAQHVPLTDHDQRDQILAGPQADAAHPGRLAPHVAHFVLVEADRLGAAGYQDYLTAPVRDGQPTPT